MPDWKRVFQHRDVYAVMSQVLQRLYRYTDVQDVNTFMTYSNKTLPRLGTIADDGKDGIYIIIVNIQTCLWDNHGVLHKGAILSYQPFLITTNELNAA